MKKKELIRILKKIPKNYDDVIVRVDNGLFMPIIDIKLFSDSVILLVKDVTKVEGKDE